MSAPLDMPALVYDGECGFCTALVEWVEPRLQRRTRLLPWQEADLPALNLREEDARRTVWWIEPTGERFSGEGATARALISCGGGWRRLGAALQHPWIRPPAALGYRFVARIRHRLPGTTPACRDGGARVSAAPGGEG